MLDLSRCGDSQAFAALAALYPSVEGDEAFVLLRPPAIKAGLVSQILSRFSSRGLQLSALKMLSPNARLAGSLGAPGRRLVGVPVVASLWRGPGALRAVLALAGASEPAEALPGTVRGDFDLAIAGELLEVAPTAAETARLRELWLAPEDIVQTSCGIIASPAPLPAAKPRTASKQRAGDRFYITTAINYANGLPHMGHAYEAVTADVIARYHRAFGREVFFLTGSDEHGQKIADTAAAEGIKPIELCNRAVAGFKVGEPVVCCTHLRAAGRR